MLNGIPYFGVDNNEIIYKILSSRPIKTEEYSSLYSLINADSIGKLVVVIDGKWLTWLRDIVFNYRDKECYLPYFTYDTLDISKSVRTDNKGHLLVVDGKTYTRYNYKYNKLHIVHGEVEFEVYDIEKNVKYIVKTKEWFNGRKFSLQELYDRYVVSSFKDDITEFTGHLGGYHFIDKEIKSFVNKERRINKLLGLNSFDASNVYEKDYRDVREYKWEQVESSIGLAITDCTYRERRLKFESLLYCVLRSGAVPDSEYFANLWGQISKGKEYIKYGKKEKLIIKAYWFDNYVEAKRFSWTRNIV